MSKKENSKLDALVYGLTLVVLSVLAVAGCMYFLEPVDPILSGTFAGVLVGALFYITIKNR